MNRVCAKNWYQKIKNQARISLAGIKQTNMRPTQVSRSKMPYLHLCLFNNVRQLMKLTGYSRAKVFVLKKEIKKGENIQKFKKMHQPSKFNANGCCEVRIGNLINSSYGRVQEEQVWTHSTLISFSSMSNIIELIVKVWISYNKQKKFESNFSSLATHRPQRIHLAFALVSTIQLEAFSILKNV